MLARGTRICLRRLDPDDLDVFLAYRGDPEVARYQSWDDMNEEQARRFLTHGAQVTPLLRPGHWAQIGVARETDNALLGDMGLFLSGEGNEAELGITLARAAQGQGFAQEAVHLALQLVFDRTPARLVWGIADRRNHASLAMLERCGFAHDHDETTDGIAERFYRFLRPGEC